MARILVVDDEEGMRSTLQRFLEQDGHEVTTAENADRAFAELGREPFDVIVSDIIMPRLSGVQLLQRAREISPDARVVLVTGEPTVETAADALRAGAFDYLAKPVSRTTVCAVVKAAARVKAVEDENRRYREGLELLVAERTRQIEEYSRRLEDIAGETRTFAVYADVEALAPRILALLARNIAAAGGSFYLVEDGRLRLVCSLDPGHQPGLITSPPPRSVIASLLERREALLVRDIGSDGTFRSSGWSGYGNGSLLALPCLDSVGEIRAVITLHNKATPPFTTEDLTLGRIIAGHTIEAIRGIELARSLGESEAKYRNLAEHSGTGIVLQQDGRLVYANARFATMLGGWPGRLPDGSFADLVHPGERGLFADLEADLGRLAADGRSGRLEARLLCRDGEPLWADISLSASVYRGRPAVMANIVDASERRRAVAETLRYAENMRVLNELTLEFAASAPGADPYSLIAGGLRSFTGARGVAIGTFDPAASSIVVRHAAVDAGLQPRLREVLGVQLEGLRLPVPTEAVDEMIRGVVWQAVDLSDFTLGAFPPSAAEALRSLLGISRIIGMALCHGGELIGVVGVFLPAEAADPPVEVLHPFAHLAAITLRRRKLEDELHSSEDQLRQAQKMESIGRLAGGVAHDFNNLLTVIGGNAGLARQQLPGGSPLCELIDEVLSASASAADLTRQLLTFSRKQVVAPRVVRLGALLEGMRRMLRRLIGEDVALELAVADGLADVCIDPGQLEQVVVNLAVNARDAMPDGGRLLVSAENVEVAPGDTLVPVGTAAGRYVALVVRDTGTGMDDEVKAHLFEPFFTTKPVGRGTGLGLATIYGIVRRHGGTIDVDSAPGRGTTFRVLLPAVPSDGGAAGPASGVGVDLHGTETIVFVEDSDMVRRVTQAQLAQLGYTVLPYATGEAALAGAVAHPGEIHLLLTDVVMPAMSGRTLAEHLCRERPGIRVLFMSGYTDDIIGQHGVLEPGTSFLAKPFRIQELAAKLRDVLGHVSAGGAS